MIYEVHGVYDLEHPMTYKDSVLDRQQIMTFRLSFGSSSLIVLMGNLIQSFDHDPHTTISNEETFFSIFPSNSRHYMHT